MFACYQQLVLFYLCLRFFQLWTSRRWSLRDQLSQRGRAMLLVVKYFAKSLKLIENGAIRKFGYCFLFAFYSRIFSRFDTMHERDTQTLQPATARRHRPHLCITSRDKRELSYRKQIARQLRTQFVEGIYRSDSAWPWNLGQESFKVTGYGTIG